MPVYVIQCTDLYPNGKHRFAYVETYHPTLETLAADLRGGPVMVTQLFVRQQVDEWVVVNRRDLMVTAAYVHHAYVPDHPVVEYDDQPGSQP